MPLWPKGTHPAIRTKMEELMEEIRGLALELRQEAELLEKTVALPNDYHGIKMRASSLESRSSVLLWKAAKIDALYSITYDIGAENARRRRRRKKR